MIGKILLFLEWFGAFGLLFWWIRKESIIHNLMRRTYKGLEDAAAKRIRDNRNSMLLLNKPKGFLYYLEQQLLYSGMIRRFPSLTPEKFIAVNIISAIGIYFFFTLLTGAWWTGAVAVLVMEISLYIIQTLMVVHNYNAVDKELLKFLDFLGNYSITSGELTAILSQISGYLEEPLKTVLEECYYEAHTTADTSIALLSMAEKIQHPKFKELVRNIEISMRYSADFTVLVSQSRKSVREHMRMRQERKSLANEAWVNILILGVMTVVILKSVEILIGVPIQDILFASWIGKVCVMGIGIILFLFYRQIRKLDS